MGLRSLLDRLAPHFEEGGRLHRWFVLYEVTNTSTSMAGEVSLMP